MTRKPKTVAYWCGRLPHWEVEDSRYFVTIHLSGSIPAQGRARLRQFAAQLSQVSKHDEPKRLHMQRRIFAEMELWLDRSEWNPHLQRADIADMVAEAIDHRHERGDWQMFDYVVMPTHIHLFCEIGNRGLKYTLEDFKRWTGHQAVKLLRGSKSRSASGTHEPFWQREWFDHWSRSDEEDHRILAYIRNNPVKAGLVQRPEQWPYASWNRTPRPGRSPARQAGPTSATEPPILDSRSPDR